MKPLLLVVGACYPGTAPSGIVVERVSAATRAIEAGHDRAGLHGPRRWPVAADGRRIGRGPLRVSVLPGAVDLLI